MKSKKVFNILLLGAVDGVFSSAVLVVIDRVNYYYDELRNKETLKEIERIFQETGTHILPWVPQRSPLWWIGSACLNILMYVIASLAAHYLLAKRVSMFLLWQIVSLIVILEWIIVSLIALSLEWLLTAKSVQWSQLMTSSDLGFALGYIGITIGINILYGASLHVSVRYYSEKVV